MVGGHVSDDSESEAGPACRTAPTCVDAIEALEDPLQVARGNAHTVVLDDDDGLVALAPADAPDTARLR